MIPEADFLAMIEKAKTVVKDVEDQYRSVAFQTYLASLLVEGSAPKHVDVSSPPIVSPTGVPAELIAKLGDLSSRDVILLMLKYEKSSMTRDEMISKSKELGMPLTPQWMSDNFASKTKGSLVEVSQGGETAYKLSRKGLVDFDARIKKVMEK